MKKACMFLGLLFAVVIVACSVDNDEVIQDSQQNRTSALETNTSNVGQPEGRGPSGPGGAGPIVQDFERSLDWAAYITGVTFYYHNYDVNDIRTSFTEEIAAGKDIFTLEELIGPNPIIPEFKDSFMSVLGFFCSEQVSTAPFLKTFGDDDPGQPVHDEGDNILPAPTVASHYIDFMLNENCVEIYFPNGLDFTAANPKIATVAHPLNPNITNLGYKRLYLSETKDANVSGNYVYIHGNTIVGRPKRSAVNLVCAYYQYPSVSDFEVFLNGYGNY